MKFRSLKQRSCVVCLNQKKENLLSINPINIKYASGGDKITFKDCGYKFIDKQIFKNVKKRYNKLEEFIYFDYLKK